MKSSYKLQNRWENYKKPIVQFAFLSINYLESELPRMAFSKIGIKPEEVDRVKLCGIKRRTNQLPTLKKGYYKHVKGSGWRTIEFSVKKLTTKGLIVGRLPKSTKGKNSSGQRNCVSTAYVRVTETFSAKAKEHVATFMVSITPSYTTHQSKGNHLLLKAIKNNKR